MKMVQYRRTYVLSFSWIKGNRISKFRKIFSYIFSICCIGGALGGGNMFQANQSFQQFLNITGGESLFFSDKAWLYGLIMASIRGL